MDTKADNQETECQKVGETLSAHFDGVANEAETQLAKAHLAHCSACAQMWREWQSLRLMEQRALEPVASGEMLPLAPVKVPRHLKSAILQQTVSKPIWQRLWPRLLTGMAVPTFAVACWLLIVATPWQHSIPEVGSQPSPIAENRSAMLPDESASIPVRATTKNAPKANEDKTPKATPVNSTTPIIVTGSFTVLPNHQSASNAGAVTVSQRAKQPLRLSATSIRSPKSTFRGATTFANSYVATINKLPQISMASFDRPRSRAAKTVIRENVKPFRAVAPKPRATAPVLIAYLPTQGMTNSTDAPSDPMLNYIAQNDVRPDDIRLAVENYRAALLEDGSNL